jgi:DNA-binding NarL/FixJ family response regulator
MKKVTVAIVDDHKLIRELWVNMFNGNSDIELIGESGTLKEAIEMIDLKRPDIVFLDINLPDGSGMDLVPLIRKHSPGTKIIALSMHNQPVFAKKMLQLGARGYITKNSSHKEMFKAIEVIMRGEEYLCDEIKNMLSEHNEVEDQAAHHTKELTLREIEIIKLLKEGFSTRDIASKLILSSRTIETHRHNILKKLQLKNLASLLKYINMTDLG